MSTGPFCPDPLWKSQGRAAAGRSVNVAGASGEAGILGLLGGQPWSAQCLEAGLTMVRADGNRPGWKGQWWSSLGLGRNPECPAGSHGNLEVFAWRGGLPGSRTGCLWQNPPAWATLPATLALCPRPMGVTAPSATTWVGLPAWHRITGIPCPHRPQERKQSLCSDVMPLPGPFPEQSQSLWLGRSRVELPGLFMT